jgi:DNA polymerase III subunit epsilon
MINSFVALDIETTGLNPTQDRIIEISGIKVVDGVIKEEFSQLVNPGRRLPNFIVSLTGITDDMLRDASDIDHVLDQFLIFLKDDVLLGHNIIFDYSFIKESLFKRNIPFFCKGIDTLYLSRLLNAKLNSKSLVNMCRYYGIKNPNAHRALDDARAAYRLYLKLMEECEEENMHSFLPKPLIYKVKKNGFITNKQKKHLNDLLKYHKMKIQSVDKLTRNEASKVIDKIILEHGRLM